MSTLLEHKKFVAVDVSGNNARFWEYKFFDSDEIQVIYGRLGITKMVDPVKPMTRKKLDTLIKNKLRETKDRPAYVEVEIIGEMDSSPSNSNINLKQLAKDELAGADPILQALIARLAEANKHELLSSTNGAIDIDLDTGIVSTELGVVSQRSITEARIFLNEMSSFVLATDLDNPSYLDLLNRYLTLVPQKAPLRRGWHRNFICDDLGLQKQNTLLDQLEASIDLVQQRIQDAKNNKSAHAIKRPALFDTSVKILTDQKVIDKIVKFYIQGINTRHTSSGLKPVAFYEISINSMNKAFEEHSSKLDNHMELWHGSRMFNILSILKSGLKIPAPGASNVTGRMFANGAYFSDQSTKSLNYSQGYWSGARENNCFMFLFEVAMGNFYVPNRPSSNLPMQGYDSTFAKAHKSGVINNEMIVYNLAQCKPKYLIEFE